MTKDQIWEAARTAGLLTATLGTQTQEEAFYAFARLLGIEVKDDRLSAKPFGAPTQENINAATFELTGYGECKCVLPQYCDGKCNPIFKGA